MSAAADFIDAALQRESSWQRASTEQQRHGGELTFYGASVGAVRGTIRDVGLRHPGMKHDEITALASELWAPSVFERRLAAVVLLQTHLALLDNTDLTRLEGFVRSAGATALVETVTIDVIRPLFARLDAAGRAKAEVAFSRWAGDGNPALAQVVRLLRQG
jgi:hypothetical protein